MRGLPGLERPRMVPKPSCMQRLQNAGTPESANTGCGVRGDIRDVPPPPTNYTEMTTEEDHCKIGLLDHDYGVVEYPFQTAVPTGDFEVMMAQEFSTVLIS